MMVTRAGAGSPMAAPVAGDAQRSRSKFTCDGHRRIGFKSNAIPTTWISGCSLIAKNTCALVASVVGRVGCRCFDLRWASERPGASSRRAGRASARRRPAAFLVDATNVVRWSAAGRSRASASLRVWEIQPTQPWQVG